MLLMAAKAAGISHDGAGFISESGLPISWNPLDNDGDALRLAVKLQLSVCNEHVRSGSACCMIDDDVIGEAQGGDSGDEITEADYAATRLAITRAAASIGERMP
jgi:hypothetical protein